MLRMPRHEIAFRGREEARKWLDCWGILDRGRAGAAEADIAVFHDRSRARFPAGAVSDDVRRLLLERSPHAVRQTLEAAEAAVRGRFDLLGYRRLDFGLPVDWHLDPVSGRRAPQRHWTRLQPLHAPSVGDSKVVWELGRHQWMVSLGQAYRLTADERLAAACHAYLTDWLAANPTGRGIHWTSSLELALRLIAWCWVLVLFRGSPHWTGPFFVQLRESIADHAAHIERYLSPYFSPNTHLTGEALGLLYAGVVFPELEQAARWRERGLGLLVDESGRQVLDDGVYFEQSTAYHCYTVEIYLHLLVLAQRNGLHVPPEVAARVGRLLDFLLFVRRPDGQLPAIGDGDGGRLLPLVPRAPHDARGLFAVAAALFGRADYAWAAGKAAPELLWLLGPEGLAAFEALDPRPPAGPASRAFSRGGYVVLRSGWDAAAHQLIFDVGQLGCPNSAGHGHADLLSVQVSAFGQAFLVDPGTYVYTADPGWRDHFRCSAAHNTVTVDGESQARPAGAFAWKERPRAHLRRCVLTEALATVEADHDAYSRRRAPIRHRRRVWFMKRAWWLIVDDVEGSGNHHVEQRFQFAPLPVELQPDGWVCARGDNGHGLWLRSRAAEPFAVSVHVGEKDPPAGWVSPDYGRRVPAPLVVVSARVALPARLVTLLVPRAPRDPGPPRFETFPGADGLPSRVVTGGEEILVC
jgi:hypothetical protein